MKYNPLWMVAHIAVRIGMAVILTIALSVALLFAYDEASVRWPHDVDVAKLWARTILRIGPAEGRWIDALSMTGTEGVLKFELAIGLDPNARSADDHILEGHTPFTVTLAGLHGESVRPSMIEVVLDGGGDPNRQDRRGDLPIVLAGRYGGPGQLRVLLAHGALPNAVDGHGETVMDGLAQQSHIADSSVRVLREASGSQEDLAIRRARADSSERKRHAEESESMTLLLDHGLDPCAGVRPRPDVARMPLAVWLARRRLPDLADRAATACAAKTAR
ncbi:MAG: ankyrin repeat domain-containing protein [Hyphomicrobiales bacterium]|nr:ankyrin repeat domain-containing protein [Hyphomicrobiales bacterium]